MANGDAGAPGSAGAQGSDRQPATAGRSHCKRPQSQMLASRPWSTPPLRNWVISTRLPRPALRRAWLNTPPKLPRKGAVWIWIRPSCWATRRRLWLVLDRAAAWGRPAGPRERPGSRRGWCWIRLAVMAAPPRTGQPAKRQAAGTQPPAKRPGAAQARSLAEAIDLAWGGRPSTGLFSTDSGLGDLAPVGRRSTGRRARD